MPKLNQQVKDERKKKVEDLMLAGRDEGEIAEATKLSVRQVRIVEGWVFDDWYADTLKSNSRR